MRTIGSPSVTFTAWPKLCALSTGSPWSWYIASTASKAARCCGTNTVSAGSGPSSSSPAGARLPDRRPDDPQLLVAEVARLAGVRVQAADRDARLLDAEAAPQVAREHQQRREQLGRVQRRTHVAQRQVRGRERDPQGPGGEQHDRSRRAGTQRDVLGVAAEGDPRVAEQALLHRCGHERTEFAAQAAVDRAVDEPEHVAGIGWLEPPRHARARERLVQHAQLPGLARDRLARRVVLQGERPMQPLRALRQQLTVGEAHQREAAGQPRGREAQLGPDACRLAGAQGYGCNRRRNQRRSST